ncbi:MAG: hypothetical protein R2695_02575 [Acidimicrobiales bacterium]
MVGPVLFLASDDERDGERPGDLCRRRQRHAGLSRRRHGRWSSAAPGRPGRRSWPVSEQGHAVTICHTGGHEVDEVAHLPTSTAMFETTIRWKRRYGTGVGRRGGDLWRLRTIAEAPRRPSGPLRVGRRRTGTAGYFDPWAHTPPGLPLPTREDAPTSTEADDGKSYRIARTEEYVFEHHPTATHFRYPYVYGPRQLAPANGSW